MCLLTFFPDGVIPNQAAIDGLEMGAAFNRDGHGYAIVAGDKIIVHRGMSPKSVIASFIAHRERYPDGPALFHSRIGTGGGLNKKNCHPFYIGRDRKTVLAHNGILPVTAQPNKGDHRSDTRFLAEVLMPEGIFGDPMKCELDRKLFERWLTPYNKIVILTTNPRYRERSYIFNRLQGDWDYGAWWSNDSYRPYVSPYRHTSRYVWDSATKKFNQNPEFEVKSKHTCDLCGQANAVDDDFRVCWACGYCADCEMSWSLSECLCYIKATKDPTSKENVTVLGNVLDAMIGIACSNCDRDVAFCQCDMDKAIKELDTHLDT